MNRVLILGASGLVGKALIEELEGNYDIYGTYHSNGSSSDKLFRLDMDHMESISSILEELEPGIVISCMRGDFEQQINLHILVANYLRKNGGRLYYCSTANVFDGDVSRPHYEDDETNAESDYGNFKIAINDQEYPKTIVGYHDQTGKDVITQSVNLGVFKLNKGENKDDSK